MQVIEQSESICSTIVCKSERGQVSMHRDNIVTAARAKNIGRKRGIDHRAYGVPWDLKPEPVIVDFLESQVQVVPEVV